MKGLLGQDSEIQKVVRMWLWWGW